MYRKTKTHPPLNESVKKKRLEFALKYIDCDMKSFVFADETGCKTFSYQEKHCRYPTSTPIAVAELRRNRKTINIWGGISYKGPTDFVVS